MGQSASGTAPEMLEQARRLFALHADADLLYMEGASGMKAQANMVSKTSKASPKAVPLAELAADIFAERPVVDMAEFGRDLLRRREAAGIGDLPRNSGKRRTPSKRALLKAIEEAGGKW
jgi:hypothetical protein